MTKIPCGGFYIDDETLGINEDGKLSVIGGGGGSSGSDSGIIIANATVSQDMSTITLDKTWQEIHDVGAGFILMEIVSGTKNVCPIVTIIESDNYSPKFHVIAGYCPDPMDAQNISFITLHFTATTASDYPVVATGNNL